MSFDIALRSFSLPESFINKYIDKQPNWGYNGLGYFVYKRTYARDVPGENRKEEWIDTVKRVVEGTFSVQKNHCKKNRLPWNEHKAQKTAKKMFELMWQFKFLPPGRGLWSMGTESVTKNGGAVLNNCGFVSTKDIKTDPSVPFAFLMDMSMLGVGIGFDTRGKDTVSVKSPMPTESKWEIPDSREGWIDSLRILLNSYLIGGQAITFDYSKIRKAGLPIKGFGGIASGPAPLVEMHESIRELLNSRVGEELSSVDIVDIFNFIGKCVVSGNVRRSSEVALGDPEDLDFVKMKQDKEKLISHRWNSNNSIIASVGMDYDNVANETAVNGEPGYFWLDNARAYGRMVDLPNWADSKAMGVNPCLEQTLENLELCNLVETFPSLHDSYEEYKETLKIAYLYAKTVTLIPTHNEDTNSVISRNRRIGCSQSGITAAFRKHGRRTMVRWCDDGYKYIDSIDRSYSDWLGIPRSIKKTSVKPSGSVSLIPGQPPGIHYPHSEYYIRRVRVSSNSPMVKSAKDAGYGVYPAKGQESTTVVIEFPIKEINFERSKEDVTIWEQVANAVLYQRWWADNQVSITVSFQKHEAEDIKHVLELYDDQLKGISFLPMEDHGYIQAPYEEITKEEYEKLASAIKPLDMSDLSEVVIAPAGCDGDSCEVEKK